MKDRKEIMMENTLKPMEGPTFSACGLSVCGDSDEDLQKNVDTDELKQQAVAIRNARKEKK